jgi:hypothetical protein
MMATISPIDRIVTAEDAIHEALRSLERLADRLVGPIDSTDGTAANDTASNAILPRVGEVANRIHQAAVAVHLHVNRINASLPDGLAAENAGRSSTLDGLGGQIGGYRPDVFAKQRESN